MGDAVVQSAGKLFKGSGQRLSHRHGLSRNRTILNNARTDVIATIETLPDSTVKYLFRVIYVSIALAAMGVIALMVVKLNYRSKLRSDSVLIWNTAIAAACIVAVMTCFGCYLRRVYLVTSQGLRWSDRRKKGATIFSVELLTQLLNLCFYLAPNAYLLVNECGWHDMFLVWVGLGRMTCWNTLFLIFLISSSSFILVKGEPGVLTPEMSTQRADSSVFDLPLLYHTPKLVIWLITEGVFLAIAIWMQIHSSDDDGHERPCTGEVFSCALNTFVKSLTYVAAACFISYFLGSVYYFRKGFKELSKKQYLNFRMSNILIRLQLRLQMIVHAFHLCSFALLWFVHIQRCSSFVLSWLGFLPSQFAMTVVVCIKCYLFIPLRPMKEDFTLQMWLREYSWSEEELPHALDERGDGCCMATEPMFCFERAVKALYWSTFIYEYKQVIDTKLTLKTAMHLYSLTDYELFHENLHDTKLMVAWNEKMVLLAFRGTFSMKNVLADLRVARILHPPCRGHPMYRPMVHRGFLQTWYSNGLNNRVLSLLQDILRDKTFRSKHLEHLLAMGDASRDFSILVTGHSLGGALATLAAYDICVSLNVPPCQIECYTFGAPRVGNYAFAHDYNRLVPNTWNVINDQDYITRTMKFMGMYKRPGQRVIINGKGDMLVRPSFIEMSLSRTTGSVNLMHHFLGSYQKSFLAIARAQFSEDSIEGGYEGMLSIATTLRHVLGVSRARLIQELSWGERIKHLEKKKRAESSSFYFLTSSTKKLSQNLRDAALDLFDAGLKCVRNPAGRKNVDGVDIEAMGISGGKTCDIKEMDMQQEVNGLCHETGHLSLESQRTESERMQQSRLQAINETDLSTIV